MKKLNFLFVLPNTKGFWPTGLAIVSAYVRANGFNVFCVNTTLYPEGLEAILRERIAAHSIDVVCTGGMSVYCDQIADVLRAVKAVDPKIVRVVGGPIVTCDPEMSLDLLDYDVGVDGEGEETMVELAAALESGRDLAEVPGLVFRAADGQMVKTPPRGSFDDLNRLPIPDYEGFEFYKWSRTTIPDPYVSSFSLVDRPVVGEIVTSRSCPFSCTFCYHPLGKKYRTRDLDHVFKEIDVLVHQYGVNFLNVQDELFSIKEQRMVEFADRIKPYNIIWFPQFRVPDANENILRRLKASGMHTVGLGVESLSDRVLVSMKKKITKAQVEAAYTASRKVKVAPIGNLIFGDEEETDDTVDESLAWWRAHPETPLNIGLIKAIPDAEIYQNAIKRGLIADKEQFVRAKFPIINMSKVTPAKFAWLQSYVSVAYYSKELAEAFGKVLGSKLNHDPNNIGTIPYFDFQAKCPTCGTVSTYLGHPYLGLSNVRVICRNLDCCREYILESPKVYRPLFSIRRSGLKKVAKMYFQLLLYTRPELVNALKKYPLVVALYRNVLRGRMLQQE
jgi:radical SAM superfamily enzyme YgiQ (UPF0313 family)